jgi:hypothetical protein
MAIRLAVDLRLFDAISKQDGVFNVEQLQMRADPLLASKSHSWFLIPACVNSPRANHAIPGCHVGNP